MDLSNLKAADGSTKTAKRIGRGQGSGRGGTSTRGHKGQKSRSGYSRKKVLKVAKCHYKDVFRSLVLITPTERFSRSQFRKVTDIDRFQTN